MARDVIRYVSLSASHNSQPPRHLSHLGGSAAPERAHRSGIAAVGRAAPDDAFAELLHGTRNIRHEDAQLREVWFAKLKDDRKEEALFEFETLLKGLACFANPRNQAGRRAGNVAAHDFAPHTELARAALARIVGLSRKLLAEGDRTFVFQRYLETILPDDSARSALARPDRSTPNGALLAIRHGMTNIVEVAGGICRLPRVPFRLFFSLLGTAAQEVQDSPFFNSLSALEFRPEFDRVRSAEVQAAVRQIAEPAARRLVALAFLGLFRLLRYLTLIEQLAQEGDADGRRGVAGTLHFVWSVLRSDARALIMRLSSNAGEELAQAFEESLVSVPASQMVERYPSLLADAHRLRATRAALDGVAANLRLEMRRIFDHELPAPDSGEPTDQLRARSLQAAAHLRPSLQNAVVVLGSALGTRLDEHGVFDQFEERRLMSNRLRRDIWMFAQILRAFAEKARRAASLEEDWDQSSPFAFVGEFLAYFRAMGYPLIRAADYERLDPFLHSLDSVRTVERIDPARMLDAAAEAERFKDFLMELFEGIGKRAELADQPFDRRDAARALRLYLGAA
jgi:hypothetical protein